MQISLTQHVVALAPAAGGGGNHGQSSPLIPHTFEWIFGLIVFLALLFLVWKKVVPNLENAYTARAEAIEGDMGRAERALAEAEATKRQYEQQLSEARTEAAHIREEAREQGASIIAEMRGEAQAEAARIVETAHKQVEAERQQAMTSLRGEVGRMSTDLASRIVGESLHEEARQKGIVERFLAELEAGEIRRENLSETDGVER
ncbi:F0F1 ATP synthase subunit B [Gephyromycinifex aptenodytis]|uniref:F0F1 ATP synthase subunit B n=1 Tax=Gephyromycinifex aptenodytis TaxID=2716227 RepID=UPI001446F658|nr:F0F1 ATP synthase subunit B [Gephyromycinifex aptenodytis]